MRENRRQHRANYETIFGPPKQRHARPAETLKGVGALAGLAGRGTLWLAWMTALWICAAACVVLAAVTVLYDTTMLPWTVLTGLAAAGLWRLRR